jgi:enterochelin esterase-like enzyme
VSPDSLAAELLALTATVAATVVLALCWGRTHGFRRVLVRSAAVLFCLTTTAATGLIWANRQVDTYTTWSSLFGSPPVTAVPGRTTPADGAGSGRVIAFTVAGQASGMTMPVYAYLPPGYAGQRGTRFPVIEALHGYPGSPLQWFKRLDAATVLDQEIDAGRMAPTVVLFPWQTPDPKLDTECADLVGRAQAETFLTVDVPAAARARLHVRTDVAGWGLIGYSAGGYCAGDLALRHPGEYTAAASLSGYASPGIRIGDGTENTLYNDLWRLGHLPVPAVALYLACARTDTAAYQNTRALARAARSPLSVTTSYVNGGGHNNQTWRAMEAPAFDWLSTTLGRPVGISPAVTGR